MPWEYDNIRPLEKVMCPYCSSAYKVEPEEAKDHYRCTTCEIRFRARWRPKSVIPMTKREID